MHATNISNTYIEVYLLYENVSPRALEHSKLCLHLLNSTIVGVSLCIALQDVREEGYEDAHHMYQQLAHI